MSLPRGRVTRRVAGRPQGAAGQGEGAHPGPRRAERRAPRAADGRDRQGLRLRGPGRRGERCPTCSRAAASSSSATSCSTRAGRTAARAARPAPTRCPTGCSRTCTPATPRSPSSPARRSPRSSATRRKRGWTFPWYSSFGSDFNYDFHVTLDESVAPVEYNYRTADEHERRARRTTSRASSRSSCRATAASCATATRIFHTYSTYAPRHRDDRRLVLLPRPHRPRPPGGLGGAQGPGRDAARRGARLRDLSPASGERPAPARPRQREDQQRRDDPQGVVAPPGARGRGGARRSPRRRAAPRRPAAGGRARAHGTPRAAPRPAQVEDLGAVGGGQAIDQERVAPGEPHEAYGRAHSARKPSSWTSTAPSTSTMPGRSKRLRARAGPMRGADARRGCHSRSSRRGRRGPRRRSPAASPPEGPRRAALRGREPLAALMGHHPPGA